MSLNLVAMCVCVYVCKRGRCWHVHFTMFFFALCKCTQKYDFALSLQHWHQKTNTTTKTNSIFQHDTTIMPVHLTY